MPVHPDILLIGHGTRNAQGQAEFTQLTQSVQGLLPEQTVSACYLELAEPSIEQAIRAAAKRGTRQLLALPVLLFAAGHAKRDIPRELATAMGRYRVAVQQLEPIGYAEEVLELSELRYVEVLSSQRPRAESETVLVMVGRGSPDPTAVEEFKTFARLTAERRGVGSLEVAFLAMADPRVDAVLMSVAQKLVVQRKPARVVIQPHLLFSGQLYDRIGNMVEHLAREFPSNEWLTTGILGPHPSLASAVACRVMSEVGNALPAATNNQGTTKLKRTLDWRKPTPSAISEPGTPRIPTTQHSVDL